jgi:hypothetical protein
MGIPDRHSGAVMLIDTDNDHDDATERTPLSDNAPSHAALPPWALLALEQYRELNSNFRSMWDVYIKFYTVFLTANVISIGVVIDRVEPANRPLIAAAFIAQNILAALTSAGLAAYSRTCRARLVAAAELLTPEPIDSRHATALRRPPIPDTLSMWAGVANTIAHIALIAVWLIIARP